MSGKDLQATFLNMYKNRELETSGNYVLSLCDGTKKFWVQNAVITTPNVYENANEAEPNFTLKFDNTESEEYGLALYNHETISSDGSTSTYGYVRFYPSVTLGTYNGSAIMQLTKSTRGDAVTESYVYMDLMGRVLQKVDEYGVTTTYEYHTDGSLKKQTIKSGDQSMVVYENTQKTSEDGQYDILTDKSFNLGEKYTYHNLFGTLDKVERLCYNESTETVYNTTNYGYDSYYEQLLSVSSTADNQTHANTLTYADGMLSEVTDGKVNYQFTYDKATDTATFKVKDGADWKKLEEVERDHDLNTVTHKYYRNDSDTPSDSIRQECDKYGLPIREYNGDTKQVKYWYYGTDASESTKQLSRIVDDYTGTTQKHYYDDNGAIEKIQRKNTTDGTVLFEMEKVSANETQYTFSAENKPYKTQKITDVDHPASSRIDNTKIYEDGTEKEILSWIYTYDEFGRLSSKTNKNGSLWDGKYAYEYNTDHTIKGVDYNGSYMFNNNYLLLTTGCEYDKGQITKITETLETGPVDNRTSTTRVQNYTYDNHGRLKTAKIETNGSTDTNNHYTYDDSGRLTQIYLAHFNLYRNQSYDDRGRITSSYLNTTSGGGTFMSYSYEYDNYGNRTVKKYFYGGGIMYQYTWTRGRLLDKILYSNDTALAEYTYDANGVRYTKTTNGITTTYFYNGNTLLGENRSDGKRLRYFYDATGLCGFSYYNGSDTKYYTYVKDVLGNIVMIKDDMGLPLVKYTYNEWGVCSMTAFNLDGGDANALEAEIGDINPFRYRGYYYDSESGLYYLMSRYYDPEIGQFISPDTPDYLAPDIIGGVDLYAYCMYNPVMYVDPSGHIMITASLLITAGLIGLGVGAVVGAAYGAATAYINGQDVFWGTVIGALGGAFMGLGAGIASVFIAPVLGGTGLAFATAQGVGFFMGTAISGGTAIAIGASIAFTSGAIGGAFVDIATQIVNNGAVTDVGSIFVSALQWGTVNTVNVFLGSLIEAISFIDIGIGFSVVSAIINSIFMNLITGAIGMIIDIERVKKGN